MSNKLAGGASHVNPFVTRLIRLQQDGKDAISGPENWLEPPLLEVATNPEESIDQMLDSMVPRDGELRRGRWHWLIGSPGNGKSAKLGLLARRLLERGFEIVSEDGTPIVGTGSTWLPYLLEVRESGKPYRFAYLVQDASVVRNPFGSVCNPAEDLAEVLRQASSRGLSLLLCTNWGVLQRLFDLGHTDREMREEVWFRAVSGAVKREHEQVTIHVHGGKTVFSDLDVTYEFLDNRSLLVNNDVFEHLLDKATSESRWRDCEGCPSLRFCPLRANRDDLASENIRRNVLDILRRAEILDGQIIVFREAVALVSLFLAGCPNDHDGRIPCQWVHDQVSGGKVFNLLARRLPMLMFGAPKPYGLEGHKSRNLRTAANHRSQVAALQAVCDLFDASSTVRQALTPVVRGGELSVDVGVERLIGPNGAVSSLDPSLDPRHAGELDEFVATVTSCDFSRGGEPSTNSPPGVGCIERHCLECWNDMFDAIEAARDPVQGVDLYFWLRRWETTCLAWIAATSLGVTALQPELDRYLGFLGTSGSRTERLATMRRLEGVLEDLLAPRGGRDGRGVHVELAASMWLTGRWAENELRPQLEHSDTSDSNALCVKMSRHHPFVVTAETFGWLSRRHELGLSDLSFNPDVLEALRRAQAQAAAASNYSVQDDDVVLVVIDEHGVEHRFERMRGSLLGPEQE